MINRLNYSDDLDFSVSHFIHETLNYVIEENISDIHFEPTATTLNIRYRKDGFFLNFSELPACLAKKVLAHLKSLANMDVAENRKPQDGRMTVGLSNFRISTIPVQFGESLVLRVLNSSSLCLKLEELGMSFDLINSLRNLLKRPHGIFIVTGPTGAGKTTTLYSLLQDIYSPKKKYLTVEDPVEYTLPGISQVAVNNAIGLNFSKILRSFLRHDPDMILVGEIRDLETAQIAIQASLTGHIVLTTLHTNSAVSAITRLIDLGLQPSLISSSLQGVLAQRLVRTFCSDCKGIGCEICDGSGYLGRTGIFELMEVSSKLRILISQNASLDIMNSQAHTDGMISLFESGKKLVELRRTSIDELSKLSS